MSKSKKREYIKPCEMVFKEFDNNLYVKRASIFRAIYGYNSGNFSNIKFLHVSPYDFKVVKENTIAIPQVYAKVYYYRLPPLINLLQNNHFYAEFHQRAQEVIKYLEYKQAEYEQRQKSKTTSLFEIPNAPKSAFLLAAQKCRNAEVKIDPQGVKDILEGCEFLAKYLEIVINRCEEVLSGEWTVKIND